MGFCLRRSRRRTRPRLKVRQLREHATMIYLSAHIIVIDAPTHSLNATIDALTYHDHDAFHVDFAELFSEQDKIIHLQADQASRAYWQAHTR